jgi:hypothetical protein
MAIPTGTKFHGVAPEVSTKNLGSAQVNAMRDVYTIEEIRTSAGTDSVYDNLVAQGTDETTTLVLGYGVSIITTSTPTDFAAKLPQPITGRSTRVVNTSGFPVYVYPSNIGGQINDLPIDTPALVPADGNLYTFVCIENPLPGAWSVQLPTNIILALGTLEVNHTNGVVSNYRGTYTAYPYTDPESYINLQAGTGNIVLNANTEWMSLPVSSVAVRSGYYTNILPTDIAAGPNEKINIQRMTYFATAYNASTSWGAGDFTALSPSIPSSTIGVVATGGIAPTVPVQIGQTGTYAGETPVYTPQTANQFAVTNLGLSNGTQFSDYYFTYAINIPASAATKLYKVKIFVEYQLLS